MEKRVRVLETLLAAALLAALSSPSPAAQNKRKQKKADQRETAAIETGLASLRSAVRDLNETFGGRYPNADEFLGRIDAIERRLDEAGTARIEQVRGEFDALKREALLANPLIRAQPILYVVRRQYGYEHHNTETMSQNDELGGGFRPGGSLKTIHLGRGGETETLAEVPDGVIRDPELSFDGGKVIFSMRRNKNDEFHIYEVYTDGAGLRQLTFGEGISDIDPMYLPTGEIIFGSTREPKYCQCNRHIMANLFKMDGDGANIHQIGHNILFEGHPAVMPDGRILYDRWEYVDKHFGPAFGLWTVNPDGTNHAVYYGNNAWSPGAIIDARVIPGAERFIATFGSCHDKPWGAIAIVDRTRGLDGIAPIVHSWPSDLGKYLTDNRNYRNKKGRGHPAGGQIDNFRRVPVKYEDPYPLSEKYFLCSRQIEGEEMGIFLLDVFGNELLVHREQPGCFDPMPASPRKRPPTIPTRNDFADAEGRFYVVDVYTGTGMERVKRGNIKWLRIVEAPQKIFWSQGNWNIDATQAPAMNWNATNNKRILGKVPVEADGSVYFSVPADKFVYFQLLDENGMMIQSMRSGTTALPGETAACVGCHDNRLAAVPAGSRVPLALRRGPSAIEPWHGSPRDFNYLTEVQPVFDRHCVGCHDYDKPAGEKINLAGDVGLAFNASYVELRSKSPIRWYPDGPDDEKVLVKAVDDGPPEVLPPYSWGSHRSRLVDVIRGERCGATLDGKGFDRIVTWIDMNAPYYGSYATAFPNNAFGRSPLDNRQLKKLAELTGLPIGNLDSEMKASQISFTRPERSPCLSAFEDKSDPKYKEALAIIRSGRERLARAPRADMPGARLAGVDCKRQEKYDAFIRLEALARQAIVEGRKYSARPSAQ